MSRLTDWLPGWPVPARRAGGWRYSPAGPGISVRPAPRSHEHFTRPRRVPFRSEVATATVNPQGQAQLTFMPDGHITWYPSSCVVSGTSVATYNPVAQVYRGGAAGVATALGGTSFSGAGDTIGLSIEPIKPGDTVLVIWTQAPPGSQVTAQLFGDQDILT